MEETKKPIYKKWWVWLIAFFAVLIIYGAATGINEAKEKIKNPAVKAAEKEEPKVELTTDELIEEVVKEELGEDSIIEINRPENHEEKFVLIKAYAKDSMSTSKSSSISMHTMLRNLEDVEDIGTVAFNLVAPLEDELGNSEDRIIIKATYDGETREEINWDNFLWNDMPDVAESYWEHPALSK